jgi:hypothetical protein
MYAAGFAEGALTWQEMWWFSQNENTNATLPAEISTFLEQQQAWTRQMAAQYGDSDPYWHHVGLLDAQMQGLIDGYRFSAPADKQLPDMAIYVMTLGDDIDTLYDKFGAGGLRASEVADMGGRDHCSALVRLLPDNSEVFVSQVTWASFTSMLRIFKHYSFPLTLTDNSNALVAGVNISFSSYPGCLFSGDDYYQMAPSMLVNLETTIGNDNPALWKYVVPQSVFDWQRNMVSNRLAHSGAEWAATFTKYASGTYLNEFLTFDFKLFTPGRPPQPGALWILDEIPGNIRSADVTSVLISQGYFPSYNIPYFPDIYNLSGLPAEAAQYGAFFTYDMCPRAQIFRRNASDVVDLSSMQRLMRYNNFLNDPLAACDCKPLGASGENAVAARCDLNPPDGTYPFSALGFRNHVGTDAKIVSSTLIAQGATSAQSGPTCECRDSPRPALRRDLTTAAPLQTTSSPCSFGVSRRLPTRRTSASPIASSSRGSPSPGTESPPRAHHQVSVLRHQRPCSHVRAALRAARQTPVAFHFGARQKEKGRVLSLRSRNQSCSSACASACFSRRSSWPRMSPFAAIRAQIRPTSTCEICEGFSVLSPAMTNMPMRSSFTRTAAVLY